MTENQILAALALFFSFFSLYQCFVRNREIDEHLKKWKR